MIDNITNRIPSLKECYELMERFDMLPNIVEHSTQVMRVSLAITDNLKRGVHVNRDLIIAGTLLHDITKTRSIETTEHHDASGGELLRELGFPLIAEIVEQHVFFQNFNPEGYLEEREIVYYSDKRVMHDTIVTVKERVQDILKRYGATEKIRHLILQNVQQLDEVENKIARFMKIDLQHAVQGVK